MRHTKPWEGPTSAPQTSELDPSAYSGLPGLLSRTDSPGRCPPFCSSMETPFQSHPTRCLPCKWQRPDLKPGASTSTAPQLPPCLQLVPMVRAQLFGDLVRLNGHRCKRNAILFPLISMAFSHLAPLRPHSASLCSERKSLKLAAVNRL